MTQQEKRPVHCETCYSLSYSVTAPLPAARSCGELVPTGTNHMDHLTAPQAWAEQKVERNWPLLHRCKPVHCVDSYTRLGSLYDERQTTRIGLNTQCDRSHFLALSVPHHVEHGHWRTHHRMAGQQRWRTQPLPLLSISKQRVSQFVIFTVFSTRTATSFLLHYSNSKLNHNQ